MAKNTNGVNVSATIRDFVNAGEGKEFTIADIHAHLQEVVPGGIDEKKVYSQAMSLATNGHIGKGYGTPEEKLSFVRFEDAPSATDRFLRHQEYAAAKLEAKKNEPRKVRAAAVSNKRVLISDDEILDYLRENLTEVPLPEKLEDRVGAAFPLLGDWNGERIINAADAQLNKQGKGNAFYFYVGKPSGGKTVVVLQPKPAA